MGSITPSTASIPISTAQALVAAGVSSPKWFIKSQTGGIGNLSGVSGNDATYNAPSTVTVATIRAEEEFWAVFYDNTGSSGSNNSFTGLNTTRALSNAAVAGAAGVGLKWIVESSFLDNANHSIGFLQASSSQTFRLCSDGKFRVGGTQEGSTISGITAGVEIKILVENVSGNNVFRVYLDNVLAWTGSTVIGGLNLMIEMRTGGGSSTTTWKHPEPIGAWTNWSYGESVITVTAPLVADFTAPTSLNFGTTLSISDASTGGSGTKTRVWKIDGITVTPANADYVNPTFTGLSAGNHTIRLDVTDDSGTDFEEKTVAVSSITGSATIAHGASQTYSTNVTSPIWSIVSGGGTINASTGELTAPSSGSGLITIKATKSSDSAIFATKVVEITTRITTTSPLSSVIGVAISGSFAADGGVGSGTWSKVSGNYPTGLSVNSAGARSGTPSAIGSFSFRLRYVDSSNPSNAVEKDFVWNVIDALPLSYGFSSKEVELFCEASNLALADNANVTSFTDQSVHGRHLTATSSYPTNQTNEINSKPVVRFNASNPLKNTAEFTVRCGWTLAKYDGGTFPDTSDGYKGLLSDLVDKKILSGKRNSNEFEDFGFDYYEFRSNDRIYSENDAGELHAPAPMSAFKLIFFRFWTPIEVDGIQLGQELGNTNRKWSGDVALLILTSLDFAEDEIRARSESIATAYNLTLADVYPYQPDWDNGTEENSLQSVNVYDAPEGDRFVESLDDSKRLLSLKFSGADSQEVREMKKFHKEHYPGELCIFRDYRMTPPEDIEGYINSNYKLDGSSDDFTYTFEFQEK